MANKKYRPEVNYEVGHGRPPKHSRWKPGQSGNPKGRPRGQLSASALMRKLFNETVMIREGERLRKVTKFEAMHLAQVHKAIKGDSKSFAVLSKMIKDDPTALQPPPILHLIFGDENTEIPEDPLQGTQNKKGFNKR